MFGFRPGILEVTDDYLTDCEEDNSQAKVSGQEGCSCALMDCQKPLRSSGSSAGETTAGGRASSPYALTLGFVVVSDCVAWTLLKIAKLFLMQNIASRRLF